MRQPKTTTIFASAVTRKASTAPLEVRRPAEGAGPITDVLFELVAEVLEVALHGHGDRVAEDADGLALHVVARIQERLQVPRPALAPFDAGEDLVEPCRTLAALGALPAGLVAVEPGHDLAHPHHAGGLVHHDDAPRAAHGSGGRQR